VPDVFLMPPVTLVTEETHTLGLIDLHPVVSFSKINVLDKFSQDSLDRFSPNFLQ